MATFTELIKSGKIQAAYSQRQAILNEISRNVLLIKDLDQENPNSRTFNRLESNANKSIEELKVANRELDILLFEANPDFRDEENYIADQKMLENKSFYYLMKLKNILSCFTAKAFRIPLKLNL